MPGQRNEGSKQLYFVQGEQTGLIKIGSSTSPINRLESMQTGSPEKLKLLFYIDNAVESERVMHEQFAGVRHRGEWFKPTPELLDRMKELWRRRQARRAELMDRDPVAFYNFLCAQGWNWQNLPDVNAILYENYPGTWKHRKTKFGKRAINAFDMFLETQCP